MPVAAQAAWSKGETTEQLVKRFWWRTGSRRCTAVVVVGQCSTTVTVQAHLVQTDETLKDSRTMSKQRDDACKGT